MSRGDWIQTAMGRQFWPMDPRPHEIFIDDIAHALSMLCRFGGHCLRFYSVAEHCVLLARAAEPPIKLWTLLHDAPEAYVLDVPTPLKPMLSNYKQVEARIMQAIAFRFHLHCGLPPRVKELDRAILSAERAQNMTPTSFRWVVDDVPPLDVTLQFWSPERARAEFLDAFYQLTGASSP